MTRGDLDNLILEYLERTEDEQARSMVGGWVALAEADIRQRLRAPWMIRIATATIPDIAAPLDLAGVSDISRAPDSYIGAVSAFLQAGGRAKELTFIAPSQLGDFLWRGGEPTSICVEGHYITLVPGAGQYTFRLTYYSIGTPLDAADRTNENLAHAPNVYLYAALRHAEAFYGNDARVIQWGNAYEKYVEEINALAPEWNSGTGFVVRRKR